MSEVELHFKKPGLQTLVQDLGRYGYQSSGVPVSGPLDRASARLANELVNNLPTTPVLEIALIGPEITFSAPCQLAITGAHLSPTINGKPAEMYQTIQVETGDSLTFGKPVSGCRAYIAVAGDWQVKSWLNSTSAASHHGDRLTPDSIIKKDGRLMISTRKVEERHETTKRLIYSHAIRVRVMRGPEFDSFSKKAIAHFFSHGHRLTSDSNRMGCRLDSVVDDFHPEKELISSGIVAGTIQVTNEGQPIILLADAQTTGGYYRIANVINEDLDLLGQLRPGDELWFTLI